MTMDDSTTNPDPPSWGPPPPPPPLAPPQPPRRRVLGSRAATAAVAGGLVVGGVAGGYVITQAASSAQPSASASPSYGSHPGGLGGPQSRAQDLDQVATVIGITSAQLQSELAAGKTIAAVASEHHVAVSKVISTLVADETAEVDSALKGGRITSAQASQLKAGLAQRVTDMVNGTGHPGGPPRGPGFGRGSSEDLQVVASAIGITEAQLQTELQSGKSIAAVAAEHKVASATVIAALVASENKEIDARVASGQMTAAQGAAAKTMTQQRVTDMVNGTFAGRGFFGGPGRVGGPWGGPGGAAPTG